MWHDVEQNTDEWLELRRGKATMSRASTFMANYGKSFGEPAKEYALQLALERITGKRAEHGFTNDHMERGHEQEPIAKMCYEEQHFVDVSNGGFFDLGMYGDSPDGLVGNDGVVEFKSVIAKTQYATLCRGSYDPAYKWQLVGHLDCTGRDWVDFGSYCSDFPEDKRLIVYRLHRCDCLQELVELETRRAEFLHLVQSVQDQLTR